MVAAYLSSPAFAATVPISPRDVARSNQRVLIMTMSLSHAAIGAPSSRAGHHLSTSRVLGACRAPCRSGQLCLQPLG